MVAHRISTVKKLDKIVLLDQGKLIGIGTHEELLATNAIYQEMVRLQTLETLVGETKHA
jgi:ATP-binding cassette subfamily B protein